MCRTRRYADGRDNVVAVNLDAAQVASINQSFVISSGRLAGDKSSPSNLTGTVPQRLSRSGGLGRFDCGGMSTNCHVAPSRINPTKQIVARSRRKKPFNPEGSVAEVCASLLIWKVRQTERERRDGRGLIPHGRTKEDIQRGCNSLAKGPNFRK